jgi:hypothetical protein
MKGAGKMKHILALALALGMVLALAGCAQRQTQTEEVGETAQAVQEETAQAVEETETPFVRTVRILGDLYYDTGETADSPRCGNVDGQISSTTQGEAPTEDGQSNFGAGYGYQFWEDEIQVYLPEEQVWEVFRRDPEAPAAEPLRGS